MRPLASRLLTLLSVLFLFTSAALAHDITISGTQNFSALDGSASDHDHASNGVFTVNDGNLVVNGTINCNDGLLGGPCPMTFAVSGNMTLNAGSALYSEDRLGTGSPASITLNVGGNLVVNGRSGATPAPIVSAAAVLTSVANGGNITANVSGSTSVAAESIFDVGSFNGQAGKVTFNGGGPVSLDGNVYAGPSRSLSGVLGGILFGSGGLQKGGEIVVKSTTFVEPGVVIGSHASLVTQGDLSGTGPITIDGCGVEVRGLLAALSRQNTASRVSVRSGKNLLVDARDLGVAGATLGRNGNLRADGMLTGDAQNRGVDLFAGGSITILGPAPASSSVYPISSSANTLTTFANGGTVRIVSLGGGVTASGRVADASATFTGGDGGTISVQSKSDANLATAYLRAIGQFSIPTPGRAGGDIAVRSYSGNVIWTNGNGDVRPIGSTSGLPPSQQGTITLTACGTVNTTGTSFPTNGVPTGVFPVITTGSCAPAAPSLPAGVPPLITCNTPPVANDATASTNEDTTVTITLSGTDADGNSLTFTIVTPPAHGSLGPIVPTGPTSATVNYTPALNYNGPDSFVYRANDGNGGTDDATVTITVAPVNDPPTFLAGPTVNVLEDSGPKTIANWVTSISPGPSDESAQIVTFTVTNNNNALFAVQPSVASNGTLTFTPAANQFGSATITIVAHDNGGTANGGNDTSAPQTSTINVNGVNDEPSFVAGGNQTVNEDAGPQTVPGWATSISAGPNEGSQTLTFVTSNNNNSLFSAQPSVAPNGTLTYTPAANANGSAIVSVYLTDNGGTANGGDDTSPTQTFTITVNAVNDAPSFTSGGNVTVLEDSGAYSAAWATGISAGPANESSQTVTFAASNDNNALFTAQPSVSATGVLTFTVAANASGSATVTVSLSDNGGTANGGVDTSAPQTFIINVTPVNDEPSFTGGGNVTVNEDSGAYSAAWATSISAGPNEGSQTVAFVASNDNNALFSVQPSVSPAGVLTFTPAANAFGSATVTVYLTDNGGTANGGDDTSPSQTFLIVVNSVNDEPSFTSGGNVTVNEDSGAYSAPWATGISAGPANESSQTVSFVVSNNNNALFSVQPSVSSTGVLSFTPAASANGSATVTIFAQDDGGTANGGDDTSPSQTFTITVSDVNDPPSFTPGANQSVLEDAGPQTVPNWATGISAGPANESSQTITFVVSNDNNALFSVQPAISPSGTLTYTGAPNANGSAIVTVYAQDNGGTANGGNDTSATYTFTISIVAVNDAPAFTGGGNVTVLEDSGAYSAAWATGISAGPPDESGQTLTFNVIANSNPSLFASGPSVSPSGVLSFTPAANAFGSSTITINLQDDGGTAGGGVDTSTSYTFTINVTPVNDAPSFTPGGDVTVNEDNGPYAAAWASAIFAGPNESGQTVAFVVSNNNNALFTAQPAISPAGILTFTPAPNAFGSATVSVTLQDNGGTANGGVDTSPTVTFTITVNPVNDAPSAGTDTWETLGNTELRVDLAGGTTPKISDTTPSGNGVRDNDSDAEGDPFVVTGIVGCGDVTAPFDCTLGDGSTLSMQANGSFTYTPGPGNTSGSFQYTVTDIPSFGSPASSTGTVNITIVDMIWYVNGGAAGGGNGTSIAPFNSFTSLNGPGGAGDVDSAGSTIFVHSSNVSGSIGLEANQKLWGEGVGLSTTSNLNGNGSPQVLVAPGVKPNILASADAVTVTGVSGVDIAGLAISSSAGNAIDVTSIAAQPAAAASIHDNIVTGAALEGIDVNAGSASGTTVAVNNTSITSAGNGFDVAGAGAAVVSYTNGTITSTGGNGIRIDGTASGNLTITGLANVAIDGNTAATGIAITAARFDAVPGGLFNVVNGGTIAVGASGNPVGGPGVTFTNVSGDLAIGTLTVFGGTSGVTATGSGLFAGSAGMRLTTGGGSISAPAGVGLSLTNATIGAANLNFTSISSNGGANGVVVSNTDSVGGLIVTGSGTPGSGGVIQNTTGHGVVLTSTSNVSLSRMSIHNTADRGINGSAVSGFSFIDGTIFNFGNALPVVGATEDAMNFTNLSGTVTVARSTLGPDGHFASPSPALPENKGIVIRNTGAANLSMSVTGTTFTQISNDGIDAEVTGGTGTLNVDGSTGDGANVFNQINGRAVTFGAPADNAVAQTLDLTIRNNTFTSVGIGGRWVAAARTTLNARYNGNTMTGTTNDAVRSEADATNAALTPHATVNATINGNAMGGGGVFISAHRQAIENIALTNNSGIGFFGVNVTSDRGSTVGIDVTGNTVTVNGDSPNFATAMYLQTSNNGGGASSICAKITGNTLTSTGSSSPAVILDTLGGEGTIGLEGWNGTSPTAETFLMNNNTITGSPEVAIDDPTFVVAGGNCVTSTP
jgi:Big-like domain-containing protein/cadherin-like protein